MSGNTFGKLFSVTTFGESHGEAVGGIIDGCPPDIQIDLKFIQADLDKRKSQSDISTAHIEADEVEFLSGIFEGRTTGTPLAFIIRNHGQNPDDYKNLKNILRPSHADFTYMQKYGIYDFRGGGRASARETVSRVVAGAVAKLILGKYNISVNAYVSQLGNVRLDKDYKNLDLSKIYDNSMRCPDDDTADKMTKLAKSVKKEGDSIGGIISCVISNVPAGLGEPVFDKLHADMGKAMLSINAAKGFDYGSGFEKVNLKGSELNDLFIKKDNKITTLTNNSGGIQGGISNGEDIYFRIAFKPVSSIAKKQKTVDVKGNQTELEIKGRHDACVLPSAVPIVEAMSAIVITDHLLRYKAVKI